jgi:hypothetical protein
VPTNVATELPTPTPAPHQQQQQQQQQYQQQQQQPMQQQMYTQQPHMVPGAYAMPQQGQQYAAQQPGQPMMAEMPGTVPMAQQGGIMYAQAPMMQQIPQQPGLVHPGSIPGAVPMVVTGADGKQQIIYQIPKQSGVTVTTTPMDVSGPQVTATTNMQGKKINNPNGFQTSVPLQALNFSAAPIDCPNCNTRAITSTMSVVGTSTQ